MPTENKSARDYLLDNVKAVLIILVVIGHFSDDLWMSNRNIVNNIFYIIYSFHMPAFIFICGYFSKNTQKCREKAVATYLIPYLFMNIFIVGFATSIGAHIPLTFSIPVKGMWFLLTLFYYRILIKDLSRIRGLLIISLLISLLSGCFITLSSSYMSVARTLGMLPFFVMGYLMKQDHIIKLRKVPQWIWGIAFICQICIVYLLKEFNIIEPVKFFIYSSTYRSLGFDIGQGLLLRLVMIILATGITISIIGFMPSAKMKFWTNVGINSLGIYLVHLLFIYVAEHMKLFLDYDWLEFIGWLILTGANIYIFSLPSFNKWLDNLFKSIHNIFAFDGSEKKVETEILQ